LNFKRILSTKADIQVLNIILESTFIYLYKILILLFVTMSCVDLTKIFTKDIDIVYSMIFKD